MGTAIDTIKDIIEKIIELREKLKNEHCFDLVIKVDEGCVKFTTATFKQRFQNDEPKCIAIDIIKDIIEKIIGQKEKFKAERYFDLELTVDKGRVKFMTVTIKTLF